MYQDELFWILSIVSASLLVVLLVYLVLSRKKNRLFQKIISDETQKIDYISTVFTQQDEDPDATEIIYDALTVVDDDDAQTTGHTTQHTSFIKLSPVDDFNPEILKGKYDILGEIGGGGMSRVFLAKKVGVGNDWIVKYVSNQMGELTNEAEILKGFNHRGLPSIIDIFSDETGYYLVQSYIVGPSMQSVFESGEPVTEFLVSDWAWELADILSYVHRSTNHYDLKPANIMLTYGNKPVLIDFGISKKQNDSEQAVGITFKYAAPEQFNRKLSAKGEEIKKLRFGKLPDAVSEWEMDRRSDIFSLGVILFEAATGSIPTPTNRELLKQYVPKKLADIIYKCIELNPNDRYHLASQLAEDIQNYRNQGRRSIHSTIMYRKTAKAASVALGFATAFSVFSYTLAREVQASAVMLASPGILTLSLTQFADMEITRVMQASDNFFFNAFMGQGTYQIDASQIQWHSSQDNIVQIDGNRIVGLNVGSTTLYGIYRMQDVSLSIEVVEPMDGYVDISMRYQDNRWVNVFLGTSYRDRVDGIGDEIEFVSPQSLTVASNGAVYVVDSGFLRRIYDNTAQTIYINPAFIRPELVRYYQGDLYILTAPWQDDSDMLYGIIRLNNQGMEGFFVADANHTRIVDMTVAGGYIYFIEENRGIDGIYLRAMSVENSMDITTLHALPQGVSGLTYADGMLFLTNEEQGTITAYVDGGLTNIAGLPDERGFIDGAVPLFFSPQHIQYHNSALYVWDFNVIRRLMLNDYRAVIEASTVVGVASPVYSMAFTDGQPNHGIVLPYSRLMEFAFWDYALLITDPKRGVMWNIQG